MDKKVNRVIKSYIQSVLNQQPDLLYAYLFGSYAKNNQKAESDIDIALVFNSLPEDDKFNTQVRLMMLATDIDNRIEPHPISKQEFLSKNPFVSEILKTGKQIRFTLAETK